MLHIDVVKFVKLWGQTAWTRFSLERFLFSVLLSLSISLYLSLSNLVQTAIDCKWLALYCFTVDVFGVSDCQRKIVMY